MIEVASNAQLLQHRHQPHGEHAEPHDRPDEGLQGRIGRAARGMQPADGPLNEPGRPARRPDGRGQDQGRGDQIDRQATADVPQLGEQGLSGGEVTKQLRIDRRGQNVHGVRLAA